jgi:hypothetical protein
MRFAITLVIALTSACASTSTVGGGPSSSHGRVNVATVRAEINAAIQATAADRKVTSMGKATPDTAVVFTTTTTGARAEETWTKHATGWTLETSAPLGGAVSTR